jgi:hypothetical protein
MHCPHTGEALRFGLDHGEEVVTNQSALLLEVGTQMNLTPLSLLFSSPFFPRMTCTWTGSAMTDGCLASNKGR